jgi:hypothetical protein
VVVAPISRKNADAVSLPPGHPNDGVVYAGHPLIRHRYYTLAEFHRRLFEHKFSEGVELLMALGARSVTVDRVEGSTTANEATAQVLARVARIGGRLQRRSSDRWELRFEGAGEGSLEPRVPEGLVWLESEELWKMFVRARTVYR